MCGLRRQLRLANNVGLILLPLRRREVLRCRAFRTTPTALTHEESRTNRSGVHLPRVLVDNQLLRLNDRARLALVIDAQDLGAQLKVATLGGSREGLEELNEALTVDYSLGVEFWDAGDGDGGLRGVEVDNFLGVFLECYIVSDGAMCIDLREAVRTQDDGVGWEDSEVGV